MGRGRERRPGKGCQREPQALRERRKPADNLSQKGKEAVDGRTLCEPRIQALLPAPSSHGTLLTKHKFKDKIIKNFMMMTTEHYTPSAPF